MSTRLGPVAQKTVNSIESLVKTLGPNKLLPSERTLAAQLNVSRSTLRVALLHLEEKGTVVNHGSTGRYTPDIGVPQGRLTPPSRNELEARIIFESALIGDLALLITEKQKSVLRDVFDQHVQGILMKARNGSEVEDFSLENQAFHYKLYSLHPNIHARKMLKLATQDTSHYLTASLPVETVITQHQLIIQALLNSDRILTQATVKLNLQAELNCW